MQPFQTEQRHFNTPLASTDLLYINNQNVKIGSLVFLHVTDYTRPIVCQVTDVYDNYGIIACNPYTNRLISRKWQEYALTTVTINDAFTYYNAHPEQFV